MVDSEINKLPEETIKFIEKVLLKEIKSAIQTIDEKLNWKLLTLEFSNMFSYGPDNLIDFTKLISLYLISYYSFTMGLF